ncbi:MAG: hypothetical protein U1F67_15455 [Rubrivivax sp.]
MSAEVATNESRDGVTLRPLYRAEAGRAARPGEPATVTLIELAPGARWPGSEGVLPGAPALQRRARAARQPAHRRVALRSLDYRVVPAGDARGRRSARAGKAPSSTSASRCRRPARHASR